MRGVWQKHSALFICPACREPLEIRSDDGRDGSLGHARGPCPELYPVIADIPRLLLGAPRRELAAAYPAWFRAHAGFESWVSADRASGSDLRLVRRFDDEWRQFAQMAGAERAAVFARYFDVVPATLLGDGRTVLDAGCGSGRWAAEVARRGAEVIALDLGRSVEIAARHVGASAAFLQADVRHVPVAPASVDLAYSLGVLHHVDDTALAVRRIVEAVRPGGWFLVYLYYALDERGPLFRVVFGAVDLVRRVVSSLPQRLAAAITTVIAAFVYLPLARTARILDSIGLGRAADRLPLRFYSRLSFRTMRNDSLDRFGTTLEKRYTRNEVVALLEEAGLVDIKVSNGAPYWHAVGRVPGEPV